MQWTVKKKVKKPNRGIYLLPNILTTMALFAGFYAIVSAMKGQFESAAIAIFIAMVMDTLDGRVARLTNTQSAFGAEYDSLSDIVNFGLAPSLVVYNWGLFSLGKIGWLVAFFYTAATALRLARFNVQINTMDKRFFLGIPCPAAAGVVAGMVWVADNYGFLGQQLSVLAAVVTVLAGLLMVSNILFYSFKDMHLKNKVSFFAVLVILIIIVFIALDPAVVLLMAFAGYALSGPCLAVWRWTRRRSALKRRRFGR